MRRWRSLLSGLLLIVVACDRRASAPEPPAALRDQIQAASQRARGWLDGVEVDPFTLADRGLDGRGRLADALEAYGFLLVAAADPAEQAVIRMRVDQLGEYRLRAGYANLPAAATGRDPRAQQTALSARRPLDGLTREDGYLLVTAMIAAHQRGSTAAALDDADLAYLRRILPRLARRCMAEGDVDLLAETLRALGPFPDAGALRGAIVDYLLEHQNEDGSWGDYERDRGVWGAWVVQRRYLPTTRSVMRALVGEMAAEHDVRVRAGM